MSAFIHTRYLNEAREWYERAAFVMKDEALWRERGSTYVIALLEAGHLAMKLGKYGDAS